jgi:hypothetical protein
VRFEGISDGDFVLEDPRGTADYLQGVRGQGFGPGVDQILPATTIRGRVLTRDGRAPAWAVLTAMARVPRAVADADGRFELRGLEAGHALQVWWEGGRQEFTDDFAPGIEAILRVGVHAPEPRRVTVHVRARCADGTRPPDPLAIHFDSLADGRRRSSWRDPDDLDVRVPLGVHLVGAGLPWSEYVAPRVRVDLRARRDIEITLLPQPALDLPELPEEATAHVVLEDRSWEVRAGEPAHLPAAARAWLRVDLGPASYTFPIGPERNGVRRADVRLPGRKIIRVPGLEDGLQAELAGEDASIASREEEGDIEVGSAGLATYAVGEQWLQLAHPRRGWGLVKLDLPFEAATIEPDCTLTPWPAPVEMRVARDDGTPVPGAYVRIRDEAEPPGCFLVPDEPSRTDGNGVLRRRWLRDGLHVRIDTEDGSAWARLRGPPPYEVRLGSAAVELDLQGLESPAGALDGMLWEADGDSISLRGLSAGPHVLIVGASGRRAAAYGLLLRPGETRRIRPPLPARE